MQYQGVCERDERISLAESKYKTAINFTNNAKKLMLEKIAIDCGDYDAKRVSEGTIWIGMDAWLLLASWSAAYETKDSSYYGRKVERWYYSPYYNRLDNLKFKFEVTVEDYKVKGWKDLD